MRFNMVKNMVRLLITGVLLCGLLAASVMAESPAAAVAGSRNLAIFNKSFKPMGSDQGSWVWRDRKIQQPGDGFEGIVAHVTERKMGNGGTNPDHATLRIWLYDSVAVPMMPNEFKLQLKEKYIFNLTELNETNSEGKGNRSFHFMVTTSIKDADGADNQEQPGTRTFLITGTRERGINGSRTLRITTFTATPGAILAPLPIARPSTLPVAFAPCTDYPDDAVLEEQQYSTSEPVPTEQPNPDHAWMTYTWPAP